MGLIAVERSEGNPAKPQDARHDLSEAPESGDDHRSFAFVDLVERFLAVGQPAALKPAEERRSCISNTVVLVKQANYDRIHSPGIPRVRGRFA